MTQVFAFCSRDLSASKMFAFNQLTPMPALGRCEKLVRALSQRGLREKPGGRQHRQPSDTNSGIRGFPPAGCQDLGESSVLTTEEYRTGPSAPLPISIDD
jgi:hypothetical protein